MKTKSTKKNYKMKTKLTIFIDIKISFNPFLYNMIDH